MHSGAATRQSKGATCPFPASKLAEYFKIKMNSWDQTATSPAPTDPQHNIDVTRPLPQPTASSLVVEVFYRCDQHLSWFRRDSGCITTQQQHLSWH